MTGRFINADGYVSTGQGILGNNMFTYCLNNPICNSDPTGQWCPEENGRREYHDAYIGFIDRAKYDIYVKIKKALPLPRQNGKTVFIGQPRIDTDGSDRSKVDDNNWQAVTSHSLWGKDTVTVLDAYEMPYVARPGKNAAELGDLAVLINLDTGDLIKCILFD